MASEVFTALLKALTVLTSLRIPHAVFGGMAMQLWGRVRSTLDADVLVDASNIDVEQLVGALRAAGCAHQDRIDRVVLADALLLRFHHPVGAFGLSITIDIVLARAELLQQALRRRIERQGQGTQIPVVTCEDLILLKLKVGRPIDRADVADLWTNWKETLDQAYLEQWADRAGLLEELRALQRGP